MEGKRNRPFTEHLFEYRSVEKRKLVFSLTITAVVMIVELLGGFLTNSIALISDAGHMFTHCFAIGISLIAILIARKPPCHHRTFGLYRAEILAAFINGVFLLLVVSVIVSEAVRRIIHPEDILAFHMLLIALIGLVTNVASIFILHGSHKDDLNVRSVFYHMIADAASSVGIVFAAIIISYTGWNIIDPLVGFGISAVIAYWAIGILKESARILLEMAPTGLNIDTIGNDLKTRFPEIQELYNVHLWTITPEMLVFSAHIQFRSSQETGLRPNERIEKIAEHLSERYGVKESTLQTVAETEPGICISG
jgi:cobalt-zinc-cadmium efflux system protein